MRAELELDNLANCQADEARRLACSTLGSEMRLMIADAQGSMLDDDWQLFFDFEIGQDAIPIHFTPFYWNRHSRVAQWDSPFLQTADARVELRRAMEATVAMEL